MLRGTAKTQRVPTKHIGNGTYLPSDCTAAFDIRSHNSCLSGLRPLSVMGSYLKLRLLLLLQQWRRYDRYWAQSCRYSPQKVCHVGCTGLMLLHPRQLDQLNRLTHPRKIPRKKLAH